MEPFNLGVRDFIYANDKGWMFVAMSEMNIVSRLDSYLTNVSMPWEKKQESTYVTVGAFSFHRITVDPETGDWKFTRLWACNFPSQTNILCWAQGTQTILLGMDSGKIAFLQVSEDENSMSQLHDIEVHKKRVMGIKIDEETGYMYSVGEDSRLKIVDIATYEIIYDEPHGQNGLKILEQDKANKRLFTADGTGFVYIYNYNEHPPELLGKC